MATVFFPGAPASALPALPPVTTTTGSNTLPSAIFPPLLPPGVHPNSPNTPVVPPVATPEPGNVHFPLAGIVMIAVLVGLTLAAQWLRPDSASIFELPSSEGNNLEHIRKRSARFA